MRDSALSEGRVPHGGPLGSQRAFSREEPPSPLSPRRASLAEGAVPRGLNRADAEKSTAPEPEPEATAKPVAEYEEF